MNNFWRRTKSWSLGVTAYFGPWRRLSGAMLKGIALLVMLIDHIGAGLLECRNPASGIAWMETFGGGEALDAILRLIGRSAFPIFAFFIAEGYVHTRNRLRYLLRLLICAVLSQWQFQHLFYPGSSTLHLNTIFTLSLGLLACWTIDENILVPAGRSALSREVKRKEAASRKIAQGVIFLAADLAGAQLLGCDYGCVGVLTVVLFYVLRSFRPVSSLAGYAILSVVYPDEIFSFPAFLLLQCYDGRKGRSIRYLFYLFYPLHLLILLLIRRILLGF